MDENPRHDQTSIDVLKFKTIFESKLERCKQNKKGQKLSDDDVYFVLRNSLIQCYWKNILHSFITAIISECSGVFYTYYVGDMIVYIRDPLSTWQDGVKIVFIFTFFQLIA